LPGFSNYLLYVPKQCVGTQRVPLFVLVHGGGRSGREEFDKFQQLADKYGVIVLFPTSPSGHWHMGGTAQTQKEVHYIDSAMKLVLRTNAIDPNRIALLGFSEGGVVSMYVGRNNLDVFSRVVPMSFFGIRDRVGPPNAKTQFLVSGGIAEDGVKDVVTAAHELRRDGHPVVALVGLRGHVDYVRDEDIIWNWLMQSWTNPSITAHMVPPADADPVLTVEMMTKMTDFWTRFQQEPDSIRTAGRMAHQERISLALGSEPVSVIAMNILAMATQYPSVAADLKASGLTAQQEAAYRAAILRIGFARAAGILLSGTAEPNASRQFDPIAPTSVLGKNLAFRQAHPAEFKALADTRMWTTQ
jgi:predicted esterase